jgi:hypothetical protein
LVLDGGQDGAVSALAEVPYYYIENRPKMAYDTERKPAGSEHQPYIVFYT